MIAQIVSAANDGDLIEFCFDYNANREHNLGLDQPDWFVGRGIDKKGTAIEAGHFKDPNDLKEEVVFDAGADVPVELVEANGLLNEYLAEETKQPYVEWLEDRVNTMQRKLEVRAMLSVPHDNRLT